MAQRKLDVSFGAKRVKPEDTLESGLPPEARRRTGRRDFSVRVPRNVAGTISAPEQNIVQSGVNKLSRGLSVFGGGDERAQVQRASDIANAIGYVSDPFASFYRTGKNVREQLEGGQPVTTQDYINLATPAVAELLGAAGSRLARTAPVQRLAGWLGETKPRLVDPDFIESPFRIVPRSGAPMATEASVMPFQPRLGGRASQLRVEGPAPVPMLPEPGPGLPEWAVKPRGGQWWSDRDIRLGGYTENNSPENAVRALAARYFDINTPDDELLRELFPEGADLNQWLQRALPRYIKNELGTPEDPLRDLVGQGLFQLEEVTTPQQWTDLASKAIMQDPLEKIMFPRNPRGGMRGAGNNIRGGVLSAMPWLAKAPSTDVLYGMTPYGLNQLGFGDVVSRMQEAMMPAIYDIPDEFVVRPENLSRMSFPQAVERVGKIEQALAAKKQQAAQAALAGPALSTFKEYPDDPKGLRWVEFKYPEPDVSKMRVEHDPQNDLWSVVDQDGNVVSRGASEKEAVSLFNKDEREQLLKDALECESDQLGICVGRWRQYPQYYQGIMSGDKRIFSLRDAKGESHATIETQPDTSGDIRSRVPQAVLNDLKMKHGDMTSAFNRAMVEWAEANLTPADRIVQIKGTANKRPADPYQPYITDFIKSGKWGDIGDVRNTDIVQLPDGRYITVDQAQDALDSLGGTPENWPKNIPMNDIQMLHTLPKYAWDIISPAFKGYAYGGRVSARDCFCHNPLSVR